jgi:hypothetical protein
MTFNLRYKKLNFTVYIIFSAAEPSPGFNFNLAMYGDTEEEVSPNIHFVTVYL